VELKLRFIKGRLFACGLVCADVLINRGGRGSGIFGGRQSDKKIKNEILFLQTTGGGGLT